MWGLLPLVLAIPAESSKCTYFNHKWSASHTNPYHKVQWCEWWVLQPDHDIWPSSDQWWYPSTWDNCSFVSATVSGRSCTPHLAKIPTHRRQLKIVLKHSWKTLSTQNGSIVFGHSIHYAPTSHVSFGIALVWTPECSGQAKKRFGFCFWICHQRNSNAGWLMWCSFPLQYWWQHFSTQVTSGKGFIGTFFAWQEGSGVPTSIALVKG